MKLNPEKCTFGVPLGKLLGYMVSRRGIDPNPKKVPAITKMKPPESLHDVQKLKGGSQIPIVISSTQFTLSVKC
jgi:hypothetical protein